jgi:hypothetical protein
MGFELAELKKLRAVPTILTEEIFAIIGLLRA